MKTKRLPITKRKLFKKNKGMIFAEQFGQPHSINTNQEFMETNFQKKLVFTTELVYGWGN